MPFTLATLAGLASLRLEVVSGAAALDRPVQWVHVSELVDPTPFHLARFRKEPRPRPYPLATAV